MTATRNAVPNSIVRPLTHTNSVHKLWHHFCPLTDTTEPMALQPGNVCAFSWGCSVVVPQGAGGRILLKTERNLVDGSFRTLKKWFSSPLAEVNTDDILWNVTADDFWIISDERWPVCPVMVQLHYVIQGLERCRVNNIQQSWVWLLIIIWVLHLDVTASHLVFSPLTHTKVSNITRPKLEVNLPIVRRDHQLK